MRHQLSAAPRLSGRTRTAAVVLVLLVLAGCGGGRPTAGQLSDAFVKGVKSDATGGQTLKLTRAQADCMAKVYVESDISDEALRGLVGSEKAKALSAADRKASQAVLPQLIDCVN